MAKRKLMLTTFRIGSPRKRGEGLRLGTIRFPPRGVRKSDYAKEGLFDVWLPTVAPSQKLLRAFRDRDDGSREANRAFFAAYERELLAKADGRQLIEFLAVLATRIPISIGCHCENERRCHRSQLRKLIEKAAASLSEA